MPVTPQTLSLSINQNLIVKRFLGEKTVDLASAVSNAVGQILLTPNIVLCTVNGTAGPTGTIISTGILGLNAKAMSSLMRTRAVSKKIIGRDSGKFFEAVSLGITNVLLTTVLTGTVLGCALGSGLGRFVGVNPQILSGRIFSEMVLRKFLGKNAKDLSDIIGFGVATHLQSIVTIPVTVAGVPAPVPPVGPVPVVGIPSTTTNIL